MNDIVTLLTSHNYLALALFLIVYARKLCSSDTKFPLTLPPQWLPVVTGALGMLYEFTTDLVAHMTITSAALDAVVLGGATGIADALLTAIFSHDNAPKWARALVFIFDDLTAGGSGKSSSKAAVLLPFALVAAMSTTQLSCAHGVIPTPPAPIPQDLEQVAACVVPLLAEGKDFQEIEDACAPGQDQLIVDVLAFLMNSNVLLRDNPVVAVQAQVDYMQARKLGLTRRQ